MDELVIELSYKTKLYLLATVGRKKFVKTFEEEFRFSPEEKCKKYYLYLMGLLYKDHEYKYATKKYSYFNLVYLLKDKDKAMSGKKMNITAFDGSVKTIEYSLSEEIEYNITRALEKTILNIKPLSASISIEGDKIFVKTFHFDLLKEVLFNFSEFKFIITHIK